MRARKERAEKDVGGHSGAATSDVGEIVTILGIRYRIAYEARGPWTCHDEHGKAIGTVEGIGFARLERV